MILAVTSTSGIGYEIIHNTTTNKRRSKMLHIFKKVYNIHFTPPFFRSNALFSLWCSKSFATFKKTPLEKKDVEECFSSKFRKKIEDTSNSVYTSKAINDKSLTLQIKTQTSPSVAIPYLGLSMGTLELFLDLKCSRMSCFCLCSGLFRKTFHVTVISLHHKKVTVTSYKYIVLK